MSVREFLLDGDRSCRLMGVPPYDSEDLLQRLLVDYPGFLAGDLVDNLESCRLSPRRREFGVLDELAYDCGLFECE